MTNSTERATSTDLVVSLPKVAFTRSGIPFRPSDDVWSWIDGPISLRLDFRRLAETRARPLVDSLKRCLVVVAKSKSTSYVRNLFDSFKHATSSCDGSGLMIEIGPADLANYGARLSQSEAWRLTTFAALIQKWISLGLPGVSAECGTYLRERKIRGNRKGDAVRTRDPVHGPFSEAEYTSLYQSIDAAFGTGRLPLWAAVLARLLFACGGRISQYASLKIIDFQHRDAKFTLLLPQAKTGKEHHRVVLIEFELSPQTGRLVETYVAQILSDGLDASSALFPRAHVGPNRVADTVRPSDDLFFGHAISDELAKWFSALIEPLAPPSERLDYQPTPISSRRFRYTFGTRMAEEGASRALIADRLGHVDLQSVGAYFEASPKIVENIDRAIGAQLAPLSAAFKGRLVADEQSTTLKGAPGSRIIDFRVSTKPVGSCPSKGNGCGFSKPDACYVCFKFEPWLDAPHEKVLARLQSERSLHSADERMAAIKDESIRAVQAVIFECQLANAQQEHPAAE